MVHQFLTRRFVVPIPELWMVGIAIVLGKGLTFILKTQRRRSGLLGLVGLSAVYGLLSLQMYVSAAVLVPWFLPSVAIWVYVLPVLRRRSHG